MSRALLVSAVLVSLALMTSACGVRSGLSLGEQTEVEPVDPPINVCGGTSPITEVPMTACGICGLWRCDGPEAVFCEEDAAPNACGECGPLPEEQCNERDDNCNGVVDEGCVIRALATSDQERRVRISGDWLVADVVRRGVGGDILALHIPTGRIQVVTESTEPPTDVPYARWSAIDGELVAFYYIGRSFNGVPNIAAHDLSTGETFEPPMVLEGQSAPNVDDGRVLFAAKDAMGGPFDVFIWEPAAGDMERIGDPSLSEMAPDASGEWLVFEESESGEEVFGRHIAAMNLRTGERLRLSDGLPEGWHVAPAIDGTRVVWHREHGGSAPGRVGDVYLFDLETRERSILAEGGSALHARIDGDLVCWSAASGSAVSEGVTAMNLSTGVQRVMNARAELCDVSGRRLAWLLRRRSQDPYYYDLLPTDL